MFQETELGIDALQRGDLALAIWRLEQACHARTDDARAHLFLGAAYRAAGRPADAVHALRQAVWLQPESGAALAELGLALEAAGQSAEAVSVLERAVRLQPERAEAHHALHRLRMQPPGGGPGPAPPAPRPHFPAPGVTPASFPPGGSAAAAGYPGWAASPPYPVVPAQSPGGGPTRQRTSSSRWVVWLICAAVALFLLVVGGLGVAGYSLFRYVEGETERERTQSGQVVSDPQFGISARLPYGFQTPEREEETIYEDDEPVPTVSFTAGSSGFSTRSCVVRVYYFPSGVADDRPPRDVLGDASRPILAEMAAKVTQPRRDLDHQGHPAVEYRIRTGDKPDETYGRVRAVYFPDRIVWMWLLTGSEAELDYPSTTAYLDSLRATPADPSLKQTRGKGK